MPTAMHQLSAWRSCLLVCIALATQTLSAVCAAQEPATRVGVLRATSDGIPIEVSDAVDAALLRDLSAVAGLESPVVSPIDYAEIQLSVGCADESHACLESIARMVRVDALVVRWLSVDAEGRALLELGYFEAASKDAPTRVSAQAAAAQMQAELVAAVPPLMRKLFGIPEVAAPAEPEPVAEEADVPSATRPASSASRTTDADDEGGGLALPGWITIGAGVGILTAGIIVGIVADQDYRAWKDMPVGTPAEAVKADAKFEDLQDRAITADILIPIGALALGLGATLLLIDLSDSDDGERAHLSSDRAQLGISPLRDGAMLSFSGRFDEAL